MITNNLTFQKIYTIIMSLKSLGFKKVKIKTKLIEIETGTNDFHFWKGNYYSTAEIKMDDLKGMDDLFKKIVYWCGATKETNELKDKYININSKIESLEIEI